MGTPIIKLQTAGEASSTALKLQILGEITPTYTGDYTVNPSTKEDITLATAEKKLMEDVVVKKIPYAEVSNNSGGITASIGD